MLRVSHFRWCATTMLCWTRLWLLPGQHIAGLTDQSGSGCCSLWNSTGLGGVACIVHATRPYLDIIPDKYTFSPSPCWDLSGMNDIEQCKSIYRLFVSFYGYFWPQTWSGVELCCLLRTCAWIRTELWTFWTKMLRNWTDQKLSNFESC